MILKGTGAAARSDFTPAIAGVIEDQAPPSTYAIAAVLDGKRGAIIRTVGLTAARGAFIAPALWVGGKVFRIEGLSGWKLIGAALFVSSGITLGMMAMYFVTSRFTSPVPGGLPTTSRPS